jgi:hypothetical protein
VTVENSETQKGSKFKVIAKGIGSIFLLFILVGMFIGLFFRTKIFSILNIQPGLLYTSLNIVIWILGILGGLALLIILFAIIGATIETIKPSKKDDQLINKDAVHLPYGCPLCSERRSIKDVKPIQGVLPFTCTQHGGRDLTLRRWKTDEDPIRTIEWEFHGLADFISGQIKTCPKCDSVLAFYNIRYTNLDKYQCFSCGYDKTISFD